MNEMGSQETRELLIGTWIGVALLTETLINRDLLSREELLGLLSDVEAAANDSRRTAVAGLRLLIEKQLVTPRVAIW